MKYIRGHQSRTSPVDYIADPVTGCWVWQQGFSEWGYGKKYCPDRKQQTTAHRFYYERIHGRQPEHLMIDHQCHNRDLSCRGGNTCLHRRCVNPDHMRVVTGAVNVLSGRAPTAVNLAKTACIWGHPFDAENTYWRPDRKGRNCKACKRRRDQEAALRKQLRAVH